MKTLFSFLLCSMVALGASAQSTASVTFFTQDGQKFWVIMDGIKQNDKPDANVKVTGLSNPNYRAKIIFSDNTIPSIDKNIQTVDYDNKYFDATYNIQKDKKGKMVVKISSFSESKGGASSAQTVPFHTEDTYGSEYNTYGKDNGTKTTTTTTNTTTQNVGIKQDVNVGTDRVGTSQSVATPDGGNVKMDMNMGATGGGIKVDDGMGGKVDMSINMSGMGMDNPAGATGTTGTTTSTTTTRTTVVTTTTGGSATNTRPADSRPVDTRPNTSTPPPPPANTGCTAPASSTDLSNLTASIKKQAFSENKMNVAKTFIKAKCLSVDQIKTVMGLFSMDDDKLEFAKMAYDRCSDKENYYMVSDALTFSSSQDELTNFINSK